MEVFIFDFDGTIVQTMDSIRQIINQFADEFGFRKIKKSEIKKLRDKGPRQLLDYLGIPLVKVPRLAKRARKEFTNKLNGAKPVPGIRQALVKLKNRGKKLGILTSNSEENVSRFLKRNNLDLFDFIYSGASIFGKDKVIKKCLREQNLIPSSVVYVGDELRDIEAAKKVGIKITAVSWGFNSKKALKRGKPDYLIEKPKQLMDL